MLGIGYFSSMAKKQTRQNIRKEAWVNFGGGRPGRGSGAVWLKIVNLFEKIVGHFAGAVLTFLA